MIFWTYILNFILFLFAVVVIIVYFCAAITIVCLMGGRVEHNNLLTLIKVRDSLWGDEKIILVRWKAFFGKWKTDFVRWETVFWCVFLPCFPLLRTHRSSAIGNGFMTSWWFRRSRSGWWMRKITICCAAWQRTPLTWIRQHARSWSSFRFLRLHRWKIFWLTFISIVVCGRWANCWW